MAPPPGHDPVGHGPEGHTVDVSVEVSDDAAMATIDPALLKTVEAQARAALDVLVDAPAELSVVLCDDAVIRPLNRDWRGKDSATDVLSFSQEEGGGFVLAPGMPRVLGDLVISVDTARRQAAALGHALDTELTVLLVHGLLHLLGHDHETGAADAAAMRAEEERVLTALGGGRGLVGR